MNLIRTELSSAVPSNNNNNNGITDANQMYSDDEKLSFDRISSDSFKMTHLIFGSDWAPGDPRSPQGRTVGSWPSILIGHSRTQAW